MHEDDLGILRMIWISFKVVVVCRGTDHGIDIIKLTSEKQTPEQQEYIEKIHHSSQRMKNMVTKILDVNAIESKTLNIDFEEVDLAVLLNDLIDQHRDIAEKKGITIITDIETEVPSARVDTGYVEEIFENLLSNAVKYSPLNKKVTVKMCAINGKVRTEFIDEGQGINKKDMKKLFRRYHKLTSRPTAGEDSTGLGLSIVKKYAETLNGKVWCESEEGRGANFIVEFEKFNRQATA